MHGTKARTMCRGGWIATSLPPRWRRALFLKVLPPAVDGCIVAGLASFLRLPRGRRGSGRQWLLLRGGGQCARATASLEVFLRRFFTGSSGAALHVFGGAPLGRRAAPAFCSRRRGGVRHLSLSPARAVRGSAIGRGSRRKEEEPRGHCWCSAESLGMGMLFAWIGLCGLYLRSKRRIQISTKRKRCALPLIPS